jgi:hypothetical protein
MVDLMPLNLHGFDLILGIDWLSIHRAQLFHQNGGYPTRGGE